MQDQTGEILLKFSRVCYQLNLITRQNFNLTTGELNCLIALYTEIPGSIKELCKIIHTRGTTTSKILKALEKRAFIKRDLDKTDKRIETVALTQIGNEYSKKIIEFYKQIFSGITKFATEGDFDFFLNFLNNLSLEASENSMLQKELN